MGNPIEQALVAQRAGRWEEAAGIYRMLLKERPDSVPLLNNLAAAVDQLGRLPEAVTIYRRAAQAGPEFAVPQFNLGEALLRARQFEEAVTFLRAAATLDPDLAIAWAMLGRAHLNLGEARAALGPLKRAAQLDPADAGVHCDRADAHHSLNQYEQALPHYAEALRLDAQLARGWYGVGRAQLHLGEPAKAAESFSRCLEIDASNMAARHDRGKALFELGCVEEAMPLLRQAARKGSAEVRERARESLAIIVPGSPHDDNASILQTRQEWAEALPKRGTANARGRKTGGPIQLGYVSAYFPKPNWMKPVWAVVNRHDRSRIVVHLFADAAKEPTFEGYRPNPADRVHLTAGLSNEALAKRIEEAKIDVLVDLNGFSVPKRLALFALRPAPVQLAWFNLYATSGMSAIDAIVGDDSVLPTGEECHYSERVERVPGTYLAFEVDHPAPEIVPPPVLTNGRFTFGSFCSQYKITDQVVATWGEILKRCPQAHLLLRNSALEYSATREHLSKRFAMHGIGPDRLTMEGKAPHFEFLSTYNRIDCALDPFPYSGGTTTTEALWQGVPVLTFDPGRWAGRTSVSLLKAASFGEFVADSREGYVEMAVRLATSPASIDRLTMVRATLRDRLRSSAACDADALTSALEACYVRCFERQG